MTRRRIVFADKDGKQYITPEFNGDKTEFSEFQGIGGDGCDADWEQILAEFNGAETLEDFKAAAKKAQSHYHSSFSNRPQPVSELADIETYNCRLIFLSCGYAFELSLYNSESDRHCYGRKAFPSLNAEVDYPGWINEICRKNHISDGIELSVFIQKTDKNGDYIDSNEGLYLTSLGFVDE